jgi:branched-subunit amino acid transport protein
MLLTRVLEAVHGHVGVLAAAALLHPAILMRKGKTLSRGARYSIVLSTLFAVSAFALGIFIYEDYRTSVKRALFGLNMQAGYLFETKEHLAYAVVTLSVGAACCALMAPNKDRHLRTAAAAAYLTAALLATTVAGLGTYVAAIHTFAE